MELICRERTLLLPVRSGKPCQTLSFYKDDTLVLDLKVALDPQNPEYYASYSIERFEGQTLRVECENGACFDLRQTSEPVERIPADEVFRPAVHFSAPQGWLNDPNGLVFYQGVYHLFYQHNPVERIWNNMHWGHATSRDLVHWSDKGDVLFPDEMGSMFSGSAIVDTQNRLCLKENDYDPIILFYTAAGDSTRLSKDKPYVQCIAYSTDGGETFRKYEQNPVLTQLVPFNRDPKVVFYKDTATYIMSLYLTDDRYALLRSENLTVWEQTDELTLEGDNECPDFYPLTDDKGQTKWVFSGASDRYQIGRFDGKHFVPETETRTFSHGFGYASQTWNGTGERVLRISWNRAPLAAASFDKCMTIPVELAIRTFADGQRLCAYPAKEIDSCRRILYTEEELLLSEEKPFTCNACGKAFDLTFELCAENTATITLGGHCFTIDGAEKKLLCGETALSLPETETLSVRAIIDTAGVEVFLNGGEAYLIGACAADENAKGLCIQTKGQTRLQKLALYTLEGASGGIENE